MTPWSGSNFARGRQQSDVPFADQIDERQAAVLIFFRDRDDEAQVALDEFLKRVGIAGANLPREVELFGAFEQGIGADLVQILVEEYRVPARSARCQTESPRRDGGALSL